MKKIILLILLIIFSSLLTAQNYNLPRNRKTGKCYERHFYYDKKFEWKEVDCEKLKAKREKETAQYRLIRCGLQRIRMKKYQKRLKSLGYEVDITGCIDNNTIIAHHKYLKKKKKENRRKKRVDKRK